MNKTPLFNPTVTFDSLVNTFSDSVHQLLANTASELEHARSELESARDTALPAVLALAELLEGRDGVTYGHSRRIARMAVQFTTFLKWPAEQVKLMNMVALLHDIGKIIIPDTVLLKEGKFTPLDYETMKLHPGTGYRIINRLGFLGKEAELWVLHHHERFDGEGYPDGLAGSKIPIGARILALGDAYDAMTETRRYRTKIAHWMAVDELLKSGGQFDPDLTLAFAEAFKLPPGSDSTDEGKSIP